MATQLPNGYIGNYAPEHQLKEWDVWGRKYSSLGLIAWYDLSGEKKALEAACKVIDHLMTQVGSGKTSIVATGNYIGMPSSSILEPVMYLYNRTKEVRYLDFAKYIVGNTRRSPADKQGDCGCACRKSIPASESVVFTRERAKGV